MLHDRNVGEVNEWVMDDLRLCGCEFTKPVKQDLKHFDAFDNFDLMDLDVTRI